MKQFHNHKGFTLIEVMVSIFLAAIIMATLYSLLTSQQKTYNSQDLIVEMQQNIRTAIDTLVRDFRTMGYGVPTSTIPSTIEVISSATENSITFLVDKDDVSTTLVLDYTPPTTTLSVNTVNDPLSYYYFKRYSSGDVIYISDGYRWGSTTIIDIDDDPSPGSLPIASLSDYYPAGSVLHVKNTITFAQNPSDHKHSTNAPTIRLMRQVDSKPAQPVVDDIDYLEFRYYDEDDAPIGSKVPYKGVSLTADQRNSIRKIKVLFIARTSREDPYYSDSGTYNCGDTYSDNYHRITLESDIKLRNIGLE